MSMALPPSHPVMTTVFVPGAPGSWSPPVQVQSWPHVQATSSTTPVNAFPQAVTGDPGIPGGVDRVTHEFPGTQGPAAVLGDDKEMSERMRDLLQNAVGQTPVIQLEPFSNWVGEQAQDWVLAVRPRTVPEVQAVVRGARALGLRVRGAGATHSWSPLFSDRGQVVVYVKDLQRPEGARIVLEPQDPSYSGWHLVTMAASITTGEFYKFQLANDICLPTNVILRNVTMGGVVLGGCHGSGWNMKSVSDHVARMRIVNSDGHLVEYSEKTDAEMMNAVKCSLGLFGIMVDMTLKVQPMMYVKTSNIWATVGEIFYTHGALYNFIRTNWSVEVFWFPFNSIKTTEAIEAMVEGDVDLDDWEPKDDEVLLRVVNHQCAGQLTEEHMRTEDDPGRMSWVHAKTLQATSGLLTSAPRVTPAFTRLLVAMLKMQYDSPTYGRLSSAVHFRKYTDKAKVHDMEWSFNINADGSNMLHATQKVVELVQKEALRGRFPLNLPLEMRFIADSDAYMAPASAASTQNGGTGHTAYIEVLSLYGTPGWEDFCRQVAYIWRHLPGARPHWCKEWSFLPGIDKQIRKAYVHQIPRFVAALWRSGADPDGMFFNQRLEKVFFPKGHPNRVGRPDYLSLYPGDKGHSDKICNLL